MGGHMDLNELTDNGPAKRNISTKIHVARDGEVVQVEELGNLLEPSLKVLNLSNLAYQSPFIHATVYCVLLT